MPSEPVTIATVFSPAPPAAEETTETPDKVTFDDRQQAKIQEIIADVSRRSGAEARAETERLKLELESARRTPSTPTEDLSLTLAETQAELRSLKAQAEESAIQASLMQAVSGQNFYDNQLAANLLKSSVKAVNGKLVVIDPATGEQRLNSSTFEPLSLADAAKELATQKRFLVRGDVLSGSGSVMSQSMSSDSGPRLETMFGAAATSDGVGSLHRLSRIDRPRYERLRAAAKQRGLIR